MLFPMVGKSKIFKMDKSPHFAMWPGMAKWGLYSKSPFFLVYTTESQRVIEINDRKDFRLWGHLVISASRGNNIDTT